MLPSPTAIPAFKDNYIWAMRQGDRCVVVDPGDAAPVEQFLKQNGLRLTSILVTHHHPDHVGGIPALLKERDIPVYGPARETIPGMTHPLVEGDTIQPAGVDMNLTVMEVPGHTLGHIAFHEAGLGWLFCGDTLFAGGCGRLFEGTPEQMHDSLQRLASLPAKTLVFCTHEYTLANLTFAAAVTPDDDAVIERLETVRQAREAGQITLPSTLEEETRSNPFLRAHEPALKRACEARESGASASDMQCFATLRRWKDNF
ncbi:hydroxyacylglutathione hydrolase [Alcanivorax sp.]|jgi:hydroxyacylglutathione hydrolase|uniref:hydroxyacylglutathione hydrolase n=1 Tax=Alcanivorax sp. TaxID=1872427 RepID=UPI0019B09ADD|nr:hydroxyacylglutathione hydrolase [Alcanivorax sp.]MBD3644639.1 hydroxyacylglutathione hydrolase [Alcanivorax sp.]